MNLYVRDIRDFSRSELEQLLQPAFTQHRLGVTGISPQEFTFILAPISVRMSSVAARRENVLSFIIPFFAGMILFVSVLFSGQILMQSVIKEKRNRIVEILLSSLSALELLAGKILTFGALALLQIAIWIGVGATVASRFVDLSAIGLDYTQLLYALPYFFLGYLLLATLFAAVAATMKGRRIRQARPHGLVIMIPMLPLFLSAPIMMAPNGSLPAC